MSFSSAHRFRPGRVSAVVVSHSCILTLLGVKVFSMTDVDRLGVASVMEETCDYLSAK